VAVYDTAFAARVEQDFVADLAQSRQVSYEEWKGRSVFARLAEWLGSLFERQE
jgi:hypothetical protein